MIAPVLSPVRWWRDDASRYVTRGPQIVPAAKREPCAWAYELLRPSDPDIAQRLEEHRDALMGPSLFGGTLDAAAALNEHWRRLSTLPL